MVMFIYYIITQAILLGSWGFLELASEVPKLGVTIDIDCACAHMHTHLGLLKNTFIQYTEIARIFQFSANSGYLKQHS